MFTLLFSALISIMPVESKAPHHPIVLVDSGDAHDGKLPAAIAKLKDLGIIEEKGYWLDHARKGQSCEGGMVAQLLIATASRFQPATDIETAVQVLKDNRILENKEAVEYWETKAVPGKKCPGRFVGVIIERIADVL